MAMMKRQREEYSNINLANVLMLLSRGSSAGGDDQTMSGGRVFACKTCNRQFSSFQALGGHRASHKKPKMISREDHNDVDVQSAAKKPKVHECSICGLEFAIGQALGGHMRRHRVLTAGEEGFGRHGLINVEKKSSSNGKRVLLQDLNLPPLDQLDQLEEEDQRSFIGLGLGLGLCRY